MSKADASPSEHIDNFIEELADWRGTLIARFRKLVLKAAPGLTEEWKWGVPVWTFNGNLVAGGVFKDHVKLNFFKGASLQDPRNLFNAGLEAKASRAIDFAEDSTFDESALKQLVLEAIALNTAGKKKK